MEFHEHSSLGNVLNSSGVATHHDTYGLSGGLNSQWLSSNKSGQLPSIHGLDQGNPYNFTGDFTGDRSHDSQNTQNYNHNSFAPRPNTSQGFVYVQTNGADGNQIVVYKQAKDGELSYLDTVSTGGKGSGGGVDPLQSQSSLISSDDHRFLFSVNSASGTISSFAVSSSGLRLVDQESSGGAFPTSIAVHGDLLYVLNASGNRNITGFDIRANGHLQEIAGSTRGVDGNAFDVGASTIGFSPDGKFLAVSERLANQLDIYKVNSNGTTDNAVITHSTGNNPFGLAFTPQGTLLVSQANAQGSVSSYSINSDGTLNTISNSVPAQAGGTCWVISAEDGRFAISSNPGTNSLSTFSVSPSGNLTYASTTSVGSGTAPLDLATTPNSPYVYSLNAAAGSITGYRVEDNGQLQLINTVSQGIKGNSGYQGISAV